MIEIGTGDSLVVAGMSPVHKAGERRSSFLQYNRAHKDSKTYNGTEDSETESSECESPSAPHSPVQRFSKRRYLRDMSLKVYHNTRDMAFSAWRGLYRQ